MKENLLLVEREKKRREKRMRNTHQEEQRPEDVEVDRNEETADLDGKAWRSDRPRRFCRERN